MSGGAVLYEVSGHVASVRLNRPRVHNALSPESVRELAAVWRKAARDPAVRVVVISGEGPSFCAGMDLKRTDAGFAWRDSSQDDGWSAAAERRRINYVPPPDFPKPLVAALHGAVLGGGLELALHCDVRIAGPDTRLGIPEVSRGLIAGSGGLYWLPRLIGLGRAAKLTLTGRIIDAEEAQTIGLVNRLTAAGGANEAANEMAVAIADNTPLAVQSAKEALRRMLGADAAEAMNIYENLNRTLRLTEDAREGGFGIRGQAATGLQRALGATFINTRRKQAR